MQIKVQDTRMHNLPAYEVYSKTVVDPRSQKVLVAEGKLILIKEQRQANDGEIVYVLPQYTQTQNGGLWIFRNPPCPLPYWGGSKYTYDVIKPILISETETIEIGDWASHCRPESDPKLIQCNKSNFESIQEHWNKILALPEHFSPKHLQAIVDGKMKDGDKVLVECDMSQRSTTYDQPDIYWFHIKLNSSNHITLHKKEKEEFPVIHDVRNLLAVLHGDGGHYTEKHGLKKSIEDAQELLHKKWIINPSYGKKLCRCENSQDEAFCDLRATGRCDGSEIE